MIWNQNNYPEQDTDARVFLRRFDGITYPDPRKARVLSVGQNEEDTANILVDAGFDVVGYDLRNPRKCLEPKYVHIKKDFVAARDYPDESFDYAYTLSAIEHFGLPVYGGRVDNDYDSKAMDRIWDLLRWGGTCFLTTPYCGRGHVFIPHWRNYDAKSLPGRIIRKFSVAHKAFFKSHPHCPGLPFYPKDLDGIEWVPEADANGYFAEGDTIPPHLTVFLKLVKDR